MKKTFVLVLTIIMILSFSGCSKNADYDVYENTDQIYVDVEDWSAYIDLPNYNSYKIDAVNVIVPEEDVEEEIELRLAIEKLEVIDTSGIVEDGDTLTISYEGKLADGTKSNNLSAKEKLIVIGNNTYIDGFESGLIGKKIGDTVTLNLTFPNPYINNMDLSGKEVIFEVEIISRSRMVPAEYGTEFIERNSSGKAHNDKEYHEYIKNLIYEARVAEGIANAKSEIYQKIKDEFKVLGYVDGVLEHEKECIDKQYRIYANMAGQSWETFLSSMLKTTEEGYDAILLEDAKNAASYKQLTYALAKAEEIVVTDEEFSKAIEEDLKDMECSTVQEFEDAYGISILDYSNMVQTRRDIILTKFTDIVYSRLTTK